MSVFQSVDDHPLDASAHYQQHLRSNADSSAGNPFGGGDGFSGGRRSKLRIHSRYCSSQNHSLCRNI